MHPVIVTSQVVRHDEHGGRDGKRPQHSQSMFESARKAVVERDCDATFGRFLPSIQACNECLETHWVAGLCDPAHVRGEAFGRTAVLALSRGARYVNDVIHEDDRLCR